VHILIIPRAHVSTLNDLNGAHAHLVGKLALAAKTIAEQMGFATAGYRVVMNCNGDGGQSVFHIHMHVLAGCAMGWPPFPVAH
jgi:histidine triad (HIT) family protein